MASKDVPANTTEAIRRAVEVLGYHASVDQILAHVREHYERQPELDSDRVAPTGHAPNPARRGKK